MKLVRFGFLFAVLVAATFALPSSTRAQSCPPGYYPASAAGDSGGLSNCLPYSRDDSDQAPPPPRWIKQWGAIATVPGSIEFGASWSWRSRSQAKRAALAECKKRVPEGGCQIKQTYYNQCIALAQGDDGNVSASAGTLERALADADQLCRDSTTNCYIAFSACSYPVRGY